MNLTREQVRSLDRQAIEVYGVPGVVLMENAGRGTADLLQTLGIQGKVVICCGKGNNGGDGFVIARHLDLHSIPVEVLLFAHPGALTGDAAVHFHIVARSGLPITIYEGPTLDQEELKRDLAQADWVVDALYGTGLQGAIRPPVNQVVETINASGRRVLAVDIPSGLDCDTGQPLGVTIQSQHTATFVARKQGFDRLEAQPFLGRVHVVPIGAPRVLVETFLQGDAAPPAS